MRSVWTAKPVCKRELDWVTPERRHVKCRRSVTVNDSKSVLTGESDMSKFKPGDKVVLINVDHYSDIMKQLMGKA